MTEWKTYLLGDICRTNSSSYSNKDGWEFVNYLDTGSITGNDIGEIQYIDLLEEKLPSRAKRKVGFNSIVYSTVRPNQLHYGIIKEQPDNFLVSTGFTVIDVYENVADADFVYYWLTQSILTDQLHSIAEQSTSAYPSIKASDLEKLEIQLPSLEIQKKISSILVALDRKRKNNDALNRNLEEQALAIFKSWFIDKEPWEGIVPTSWEKGMLGDFVTIKRGGSPRPIQEFLSVEGLRWLKISDVTSLNSPFVIDIAEHIKESGLNKTVYLNQGALVLSNSATPGVPKILDVDSCIHDGWLYFKESQLSNQYLYLFFKHIRPNLVALGNGSVFTNLKTDILKGYSIVKPDNKTLKDFDEIVIPMFGEMRRIAREIHGLSEIRDNLLSKLMSGDLDVSVLDV